MVYFTNKSSELLSVDWKKCGHSKNSLRSEFKGYRLKTKEKTVVLLLHLKLKKKNQFSWVIFIRFILFI